jgi:hypothetical protein
MQLEQGEENEMALHSIRTGKPLGKWSLTRQRRKSEGTIKILNKKNELRT